MSDASSDMFATSSALGRCKVICFHPRHDLTLSLMSVEEILHVIDGWKKLYVEEGAFLETLGSEDGGYVQIFEVCLFGKLLFLFKD